MAEKNLLLEMFLDEVHILENGKAQGADAQNVVTVSLIWPRALIAVRSSVKVLRLEDGAVVDFRRLSFSQRILFKENVQNKFGITVEVSERQSPTAIQKFISSAMHQLVAAAWPVPDSKDFFPRIVRQGAIGGFLMLDREPEDKIQLIAYGDGDLEPAMDAGGALKIPLSTPADIKNPRAAARDRNKLLLKAGDPNGHVILSYKISA